MKYIHHIMDEEVNAFQMTSKDIVKHGDDPNWGGWPNFIQKAMKRKGFELNSINMLDGFGDLMSDMPYGKSVEFFHDTDWIIEDSHNNLYIWTHGNFGHYFSKCPDGVLHRFTPESKAFDSTMPPEGLTDSIEINESPKIGVKIMSYRAVICPDCKQVYSVLEPDSCTHYENVTRMKCICDEIFDIEFE